MRNAETILNIIRDRGKRKLPLDDVYRQLYNPDMYMRAYAKLYKNDGAMTQGITDETVDGMSQEKIASIIEAIRYERWHWTPVRRKNIPKPKGGTRPLGMPTWTDKLVQEVIRMILEAYYEPQFSEQSHGFRPNRGCHTALHHIHKTWSGTKWFIEGDIKGCFDSIDHNILMNILRENIKDNRFLRLIEGALKAGYCEEWKYHPTHSGTPQGGIVSPILSNIYMDRLDKFVKNTLSPEYTRGTRREGNAEYERNTSLSWYYRKKGDLERAELLRKEAQKHPSGDPNDPNYRRLNYVRYADDFLLGFIGSKAEAEEIKEKVTEFLQRELHLTLAVEKTLITHALTGRARFLGYEIRIMESQTKFDVERKRSVNGKVTFYIPEDVIQKAQKRYEKDGKVIHRTELLNDSEYDIITLYQGAYRGLVGYYGMATNLPMLHTLRWKMETSLLKTLASKNKTTVMQEVKRLKTSSKTRYGQRKCLKLVVPREGKKPLIAIFGGLSLRRKMDAAIKDQVIINYARTRSEIIERLLHDKCAQCGAEGEIEMHHIRKLADLKKQGKREKPPWMQMMISRKRKSIPLCKRCHKDIHYNRPKSTRQEELESRVR
jgi:group II intron reverse transcriptase/maturase